MAPKRRLSTITSESQEGDVVSEEDVANTKKVRWETIAGDGDNESDSEESEADHKVDSHVLPRVSC